MKISAQLRRWNDQLLGIGGRLSPLVTGLLVAAGLLLCWAITYALGGTGRVPPHWFYIPILLAGARFGLGGAAVTAAAAGVLAGPLMPSDVQQGTAQPLSDWGTRAVLFIGIGLMMSSVLARLHASVMGEFRLLAERSTDMISRHTPEGVYLYASPACRQLLGYGPEELVGRSAYDFFHPDDLPAIHKSHTTILETPDVYTVAYRIRRKDGSYTWFESRSHTIRDPESGEAVEIQASSRDISERKEADEAARLAQEEAEAANQAKSEFLSRMSHELRTPLNAILGFGQLLEMDQLADDQRESVHRILQAGRHLLNLVDEVLDIARIETGRFSLSLEPVPIAEVIQEGLDLVSPLAGERGVVVDTSVPEGCECHVRADRQRIKQVLLNLLSNAIKYNREGGEVSVHCDAAGERVRVSVIDTGPGLGPRDLEKLFQPFERLNAEQAGVEGTGLGLALSQGLVEAMGGSIGVESTPGKGTTFSVELARAEAPASDADDLAEPGASPPQLDGRRRKVLYIEDNLSNLKLIQRILAHRPRVELLSAMQGSLGLDLARKHHPDLVLLDLHLPDLSGEEVLSRLREGSPTESVPVVVISANATPGQRRRLLEAGASAYLTKPIDVREFLEVLDASLEGQGVPRAS